MKILSRKLAILAVPILLSHSYADVVSGRVQFDGPNIHPPRMALFLDGAPQENPAPTTLSLNQEWTSFWPKLQVAAPEAELDLVNRDSESHTIHGQLDGKTLFNLAMVPGGETRRIRLPHSGVISIGCDLHSFMSATIILDRAPYAIVEANGSFVFKTIPKGRYALRIWRSDQQEGNGWSRAGVVSVPEARAMLLRVNSREAAISYVQTTERSQLAAPSVSRTTLPSWLARAVSLEARWPKSMTWVLIFTALAIVLGHLIAIANLRLAKRKGWTRMTCISLGCGLAFVAGAMVIFGLHGAVASALGFGVFVGTIIFGFVDFAP